MPSRVYYCFGSALSFLSCSRRKSGDPSVADATAPLRGAPRSKFCREALPLLGEVARSAEGVARGERVPLGKRQGGIKKTLVIPRPVTDVTGRGNPHPFCGADRIALCRRRTDCHVAPLLAMTGWFWAGASILRLVQFAGFTGRHRGRPLRFV